MYSFILTREAQKDQLQSYMTVYTAYAFPKYILHGRITVILKTSVKNWLKLKLKINLFKSVEQEQCPELEHFVKSMYK